MNTNAKMKRNMKMKMTRSVGIKEREKGQETITGL